MQKLLLPVVCLMVLVAGCAEKAQDVADNMTNDVKDRVAPSNDDARALLTSAAVNLPERYGFEFKLFDVADNEMLAMTGAVNNVTGQSYFTLRGDPATFGDTSGPGGKEAAAVFTSGFAIYMTNEGGLYLVNGTAFVFPPSDGSGSNSYLPSPEESPFGQFMDPKAFLANVSGDNVSVTDVKVTTYRGKPAVEVSISSMDDGEEVTGKVVLFQSPPRIAHIEANGFDTGPKGEKGSIQDGRLVGDLFYDEEAKLEIPTNVQRSHGLTYKSDANPFAFGGNSGGETRTVTWTFLVSGGIALEEVEVHAKDATQNGGYEPANAPTLWTMKLSDGNAEHDGFTAAYNDVDADGKVSKGDTMTFTGPGDEAMPTFALRDTVTGIYVVPGPALFGVLAALGALALVLRRR